MLSNHFEAGGGPGLGHYFVISREQKYALTGAITTPAGLCVAVLVDV